MTDTPPAAQISTPLAQLRAQAAAAKSAETAAAAAVVPPPALPLPPSSPPASLPPPPPHPPAANEDAIMELAAASAPVAPLPTAKPAAAPSSCGGALLSFVSVSQLKFCLAVAVVFFIVTMMPVEVLIKKFSVLDRLPFANILLKALTAGIAVTAASPSFFSYAIKLR